jgi:hypothetical protein
MASKIINGFTGHTTTWWRWISQQANDDMLKENKAYEVVFQALTTLFYGI